MYSIDRLLGIAMSHRSSDTQLDKAYLSYLINQAREWATANLHGPMQDSRVRYLPQILAPMLFNYHLSRPVQSFLFCGNYLWSHLGQSDFEIIARQLDLTYCAVSVFAEDGHDPVGSGDAAQWLQIEEFNSGQLFVPRTNLEVDFSIQMLDYLLNELVGRAKEAVLNGELSVNEIPSKLAQILSGDHSRLKYLWHLENATLIHESSSPIHRTGRSDSQSRQMYPAFSRSVYSGDTINEISDDLHEELYGWARSAPVSLPSIRKPQVEYSVTALKYVLEAHVVRVLPALFDRADRGDHAARLILRELIRLANMTSVAKRLAAELINSDVSPQLHHVEAEVGWLSAALCESEFSVVRDSVIRIDGSVGTSIFPEPWLSC